MRYPTMEEIEVPLIHGSCYLVGATVSLDTGAPVAELRLRGEDGFALTPEEAEKLAAALLTAAACARAKAAHRG